MKYRTLNQGQTTTPGTSCPTFYEKCVGSTTFYDILEQDNNFASKMVLEFTLSHAPEVAQEAM